MGEPGHREKPPGSGRQKGTPNKKDVLNIDTVRGQVAAELKKNPSDITGVRILYLVANRANEILGLKGAEQITMDQAIDAAGKLSNFEVPKKRAIEVTGLELTGGGWVLSEGKAPPEGETDQEWAERSGNEADALQRENAEKRLAQLEAEKAAERKGQ